MQHNPMMSPGPMNQPMNQQMAMSPAGPMGMSPQHAPQQMSHGTGRRHCHLLV